MPPQNIYDHPEFFAGYAKLRENPHSANALMIDPTRDALVPSLAGKRVLDLGCGTGNFCRKALAEGAASVTGVDVSERMLAVAQTESPNPASNPRLSYILSPLETFTALDASADLIVSILAFHYLADITPVFTRIANILAAQGTLVFCVEHPIISARREGGWIKDAEGNRLHWPVDDYSEEGERIEEWIVSGVQRYHRTVATYLNTVITSGLRIEQVIESTASDAVIAAAPQFLQERRRPAFLFVKASKFPPPPPRGERYSREPA